MTTAPTSPKAKRRWLQFSLRTLLVLMLVISVPLGWLSLKLKQATVQRHAVDRIEQMGGTVWYAYQRDNWGHFIGKQDAASYHTCQAATARLFGDDLTACITGVDLSRRSIKDEDLACLLSLRHLEVLWLHDTAVTDTGLVKLLGLTRLKYVSCESTKVTAAGVNQLKKALPNVGINR